MEAAPIEPEPDPMNVHYFAEATVHELIRKLVAIDRDDFIDDLPKGNGDASK